MGKHKKRERKRKNTVSTIVFLTEAFALLRVILELVLEVLKNNK